MQSPTSIIRFLLRGPGALQSRTARAAGAVAGAATAVGLLLTVHGGLFGYTESLSVPYATLSLAVEFTAAFVLLLATAVLALSPTAHAAGRPRRAYPQPARFRILGH
jgi:hypothetical protein